ncbi:MAG: LysM peptidoglycan-binding domain-containing protein [Verrucomicrobiota bacterium]
MKPTLLIATLSMALAAPSAFAKSELETLRSLCQEQKRQINELEEANERLRADRQEARSTAAKQETNSQDTTKSAAVAKPAAKPATAAATYTVKAGDNFDKIARKVGTNPEKLAKTNGLKTSSIIHPGQKLKVPGTAAASTSRATSPVAATNEPAPKSSSKTHQVRTGETMFSISKKHGMSTEALTAANPKLKASSLRPGQVVSLGGDAPATSLINAPAHSKTPPAEEKSPNAAPAPVLKSSSARENSPTPASTAPAVSAATPETKPAPETTKSPATEKDAQPPAAAGKIRPITIEGEMTYGEFATKHGTNAERLNALNGLDLTTATVLAKGSELYVPAQP